MWSQLWFWYICLYGQAIKSLHRPQNQTPGTLNLKSLSVEGLYLLLLNACDSLTVVSPDCHIKTYTPFLNSAPLVIYPSVSFTTQQEPSRGQNERLKRRKELCRGLSKGTEWGLFSFVCQLLFPVSLWRVSARVLSWITCTLFLWPSVLIAYPAIMYCCLSASITRIHHSCDTHA